MQTVVANGARIPALGFGAYDPGFRALRTLKLPTA
jgi:hypothetical protein